MNEFLLKFFEAVPSYAEVISSSNVLQKYVDFGEVLMNEMKRYYLKVHIKIIFFLSELYINVCTA